MQDADRPDEEKCLYLIDRFDDERYVRKLATLLEQTMYRVCHQRASAAAIM
ncbi:MAG: hypothetical protein ACLVJ6_15775 [Merdibacter sp.]